MKLFTITVLLLCLSSCSTIVTTFSDEPVRENKTSRSLGEKLDDRILKSKARINLSAEPSLADTNIEVISYEGQIILIGQVQKQQQLALAESAISTLRDVRSVKNLLTVQANISLGRRLKDSFISTRLKSKLLLNNEDSLGNVKTIVENGEVYLFGLATLTEIALAVDLAKETSGVRTVVKIFSQVR